MADEPIRVEQTVWAELPPIRAWEWRLIGSGLAGPGQKRYLRRLERMLRGYAASLGLTLVGDPVAVAAEVGGRVVLRASALAVGPVSEGAEFVDGPVDVVDREDGEKQ